MAITSNLNRWRHKRPPKLSNHWQTRACITAQTHIGWESLCYGFIARAWQLNQQPFLEEAGSLQTGAKWARQLITQLHTFMLSAWNHHNEICHNTITPSTQREIHQLTLTIRSLQQRSSYLPQDDFLVEMETSSLDLAGLRRLHTSLTLALQRKVDNQERQNALHAQERACLLTFLHSAHD